MENVGIFDIESNDWNKFEVLGFFDGQDYFTFDSIKKFISFLNKKKYNGFTVYAHNGGRFDFLFILEEIIERRIFKNLVERVGSILCIEIQHNNANITFSDSYAFLPSSLKNLCKTFKTVHQKKDFDVTKGVSKKDKNLMRYLKEDCLSLYEVIEKYRRLPFIENPKLTIASQALDTFKNQFCDGEILQLNFKYEKDIRENFYTGGRVEMFKGYGKNLNMYDVNSLYPFAMNQEMPCGVYKPTSKYMKGNIGFYHVTIKNLPTFYISPLVIKKNMGDYTKNFYVNGDGKYCISSAMIDYLKSEFGVKIQVESGIFFKDKKQILSEYVKYFFDMKRENKNKDEVLYYMAKLFLNSLYGKFAQQRTKDVVTFWNKNIHHFKTFYAPLSLVLVERHSKNKFILPALASYITELGRIKHFQLMNENQHAMFYCDTDSLVTTKEYETGDELGQLSLVGKFNEGVFLSPKSYALQNRKIEIVKFKGFQSKEISFSDMKKSLLKGKVIEQTKDKLLSFRECIKRKTGIISDEGRFLKVVSMTKKSNTNYTQRQLKFSSKYVLETAPLNYEDVI